MKQFLKFFFASLLGSLASIIVLFFLSFIIMAGIISMVSSEETVRISNKTVLELSFEQEVPERSQFDRINMSSLLSSKIGRKLGLNDIVENIKKAKVDSNIAVIYLKLDNFNVGGYATIEPIRKALIEFKESGKPILSHGNSISQSAYYLASVSDTIYLTPTGDLEFKGLSTQLSFFKKTLDKLDIEVQVVKVGKFKSAVEPFILEEMSAENREQVSSFVNSINNYLLENIAVSRNLEKNKITSISENMLAQSPEEAISYGLVDKLMYEVEVVEQLKSITERRNLKTISLKKYSKVSKLSEPYTANRIAVVYANGDIGGGKGSSTNIGRDNIVDAIRLARNSQSVKAIVMRVNSPGGSALISDLIWKEVELAKAQKPVVVSFGKYAASGGYYISCGADKIFSEPTTLTGSIGVFGLIPNLQNFFDNKLGISFDGVKTGKYSDYISTLRPLTFSEKAILQKQVNTVYQTFVNYVVDGRNMTFNKVDAIGQGRIWSGIQAKDLGLVDELGGLDDAILSASSLAEIDEYRIVEYPKVKEPFEEILETLQEDLSAKIFSEDLENVFGYYDKVLKIVKSNEVQARLPFEIEMY
jgi:protease-4